MIRINDIPLSKNIRYIPDTEIGTSLCSLKSINKNRFIQLNPDDFLLSENHSDKGEIYIPSWNKTGVKPLYTIPFTPFTRIRYSLYFLCVASPRGELKFGFLPPHQ